LTILGRPCGYQVGGGGGLAAPLEVGSMLLRRSTDGGETWLPMQTLTAGNIDFYTVVYRRQGC
jgi:hypothetical protein